MIEKEVGIIFTRLDPTTHRNSSEPLKISEYSKDDSETRHPGDSNQFKTKAIRQELLKWQQFEPSFNLLGGYRLIGSEKRKTVSKEQ